jgi:hypothetical protein
MKKSIVLQMMLMVSVVLLTDCSNDQKSAPQAAVEPTAEQLVQKGEYLVTIMGCNDCHSPKRMGPHGPEIIPELMLSGYPSDRPIIKADPSVIKKGLYLLNDDLTSAAGPWGISFAGNLTSDPTGIGNWTEENFKRALKEGKFKGLPGSRTLLPPMPWTNFANIKDEDVKAMFAYLKSTNPVRNVVPAAIPPEEIK